MKRLAAIPLLALLALNPAAIAQEHGRINKRVITESLNEKVDVLNLALKIVELKDNSGLVYLGGKVEKIQIAKYLDQLESLLGEDFKAYRANQSARDHHTFHLTLVNPFELREINGAGLEGKTIDVTLHGVGKAENEKSIAYYVVATSTQGQFLRQKHGLKQKDFHVTLGFKSTDVYNRGKGVDTLISQ